MKNFAVVYNGGNDQEKYVGSLMDYKAGEFSADPILMSEEEANELIKELDDYVRNEEYIGTNNDENEVAHWSYVKGKWGFQIEELDIEDDEEISINVRIGNRIQELRKEAGMTQTQLAEKCGMAQPNIARIEAGTYATSIDVLSRIAEALGKRIELV